MTFNANKEFRDRIQTALANDLPAIITAVATEQSVTLPAIRARYTAEQPDMLFPSTMLTPPRGTIADDGAVVSTCDAWVLISATGSKPDVLEAQMTGYITAAVRCFIHAAYGGWMWSVTEYDMSPQTISESKLIQTAAIRVVATIVESA